jgi:hypothetical protein
MDENDIILIIFLGGFFLIYAILITLWLHLHIFKILKKIEKL